jgi:hypothetical protein
MINVTDLFSGTVEDGEDEIIKAGLPFIVTLTTEENISLNKANISDY